jgi:signal transduction histidine kinase
MNVNCPQCNRTIEAPDIEGRGTVTCECGAEITYGQCGRTSTRRTPSRRKLIQCSRCNRIYDPREIQDGKKICFSCGNLITLKDAEKYTTGKQTGDRQVAYARTEMRALLELCRLMSSSYERDTILTEIMRITTDILMAEGSSIILLDEDKDEMIFHIATGSRSEELKRIRLKVGEGIAGHVFRTKTPLIVNNVKKDAHFSSKVDTTVKFVTENILCVPITVGDRIIGVLEAVNKKNRGIFDDYDLKISEAIASHAGLAIEKAKFISESMRSERLIAIGQTIGNLSFCIKNILTNLEGWAYNMDMALQDRNFDDLDKGWDKIKKNIMRISDLVRDMLLFSSEQEKEYYPTDLNAIIEEIVELLKEKAREKNIRIRTSLDRSMKSVYLTSKNMYRCIVNLVTNALEAVKADEGLIEIHSTRGEHEDLVFIEIVDNGPGIPPDIIEKIFNPFFTTRGFEHSGLGLPIAKKIIEEQGGGLVLESQLGSGTRLLLKIPIAAENERRGA